MRFYGKTDKGKVRKDNQDTYILEELPGGGLAAVVCDGMGGANAGAVASSVAAGAFMESVRQSPPGAEPEGAVKAAAESANGAVYERSLSDDGCRGMGTTMVGALITDGGLVVFNIGDSRAYILGDGKTERVTRDHSLVEELVKRGEITPAQARSHPQKNLITRALGLGKSVDCDIFRPRLEAGEILLLCTDGLSNMLTDEELSAQFKKHREPAPLCRALIKAAISRGAPDNVTAVAILTEDCRNG